MTTAPDPIDAALHDPGYLEDRKFTEGVLATLPARRSSPRAAVLLVAGAAAGLLGAVTLGEPITDAALVLGASGATGILLVGAAMALAAGAMLRAGR